MLGAAIDLIGCNENLVLLEQINGRKFLSTLVGLFSGRYRHEVCWEVEALPDQFQPEETSWTSLGGERISSAHDTGDISKMLVSTRDSTTSASSSNQNISFQGTSSPRGGV